MHVAVIGAGAAGICVARHLTAANSNFSCVVYEQTGNVGGTWVYTEATGTDKYGLPIASSMYKNLRTNLVTKNMEFPDFPFLNVKSFPTGPEVLQYLEDYSNHYDLKKHIKFFHHVKSVKPKENRWQLITVDLHNGIELVEHFDAVAICIGHYSVPRLANIPGLSSFQGLVQHSHSYRTPEPFTGQTVLVCGGGPSGIDISFDLAEFASKVYFSHRDVKKGVYPKNVEEVPVVRRVQNDRVVFEDETTSGHIDAILLCTGYSYSYPFLTPECGVSVIDGLYVEPLYKHIININHPTMGFIGVSKAGFTFPVFHQEVLFFLKSLKGEFQLPDKDKMLAELDEFIRDKRDRGVPLKFYHRIEELDTYVKQLETMAKIEPLPPIYFNLYFATEFLIENHLKSFREAIFEVVDDHDFNISGVNVDKEELIGRYVYNTPQGFKA